MLNADRLLNTQQFSTELTDEQMDTLLGNRDGKIYRYSWKKTTFPETILAYGDFVVQKATQ